MQTLHKRDPILTCLTGYVSKESEEVVICSLKFSLSYRNSLGLVSLEIYNQLKKTFREDVLELLKRDYHAKIIINNTSQMAVLLPTVTFLFFPSLLSTMVSKVYGVVLK